MVKKLLLFFVCVLICACQFMASPEHTNPFDPDYGNYHLRVSISNTRVLLNWDVHSNSQAYIVVSSVFADEVFSAVTNYSAAILDPDIGASLYHAERDNGYGEYFATNRTAFVSDRRHYFAVIYKTPDPALPEGLGYLFEGSNIDILE